jgi:hypothetical protein
MNYIVIPKLTKQQRRLFWVAKERWFTVNAEKGTVDCCKCAIDRLLSPGVQRAFLQLHLLLSEGRSVRVQCSLPSLYITLNVHLTWHSDVWSNYFQDVGRSVIMLLRRLPLSLVVLPTKVNIYIAGHLATTSERAMDDLCRLWAQPAGRCVACARTRPLVDMWR